MRGSPERPWVSANFAITWDGRISTRSKRPSDFSSKEDKRRFLELRARADAILAGVRTAKADHMTMGLPLSLRQAREERGQTAYPLRVLVSNSGRVEAELPIFQKRFSPLHLFSTGRMPRSIRESFPAHVELHLQAGSRIDLRQVLAELRKDLGVRRLHCEGGGSLLRALLEEDLVDELLLTLCPRIFGSRRAATLSGLPGQFLPRSSQLKLTSVAPAGDECFLRYKVQHPMASLTRAPAPSGPARDRRSGRNRATF